MGINDGKTRRNRVIFLLVACVAAIGIGFCIIFGNPFTNEPKAEATKATKPVYPERGYAADIVNVKGTGVLRCDKDVAASTELADSGGTVSVNGLLVTSEWTSDGVTVTFSGVPPFVSGYVIGSEATEPFNMPELGPNEVLNGITLDTKDFSKSGQFQDIVLCGGGM